MRFCDYRSGRFDMLVSMSDKELKRLSVLQEICDQRITQSQAAQLLLLHISECQVRRLLQKYKVQGPAALAHTGRGKPAIPGFLKNSDSSASILFLINCMVSDQPWRMKSLFNRSYGSF